MDISAQHSKTVDSLASQQFDLVVTTCDEAKEACPLFPEAKETIHWGFPDPSAVSGSEQERLAAFREVRDGLAARVDELVGTHST